MRPAAAAESPVGYDLRLLPVVGACWAAALMMPWLPGAAATAAGTAAIVGCSLALLRTEAHRHGWRITVVLMLLSAGACGVSAGLQALQGRPGELMKVLSTGQVVTFEAVADANAKRLATVDRFSGAVRYSVALRITRMTLQGRSFATATPVLALGGEPWGTLRWGDSVQAAGSIELTPAGDRYVGLLSSLTDPRRQPAGGWLAPTHSQRDRFIDAVRAGPGLSGELLPGMVLGDRSAQPDGLRTAMVNTGLTHLTAVSGANCAYLLGAVVLLARCLRFPRWASLGCGLLGLVFFVATVQPEPSVLRAAAMGSIGACAVFLGQGRKTLPLLYGAVAVLLIHDPWLAADAAFQLSVLATAGIVLFGRRCAHWLSVWLPPPLAQALALPMTAQVFCAPVIVLLQPQLTTYSLAANVAVAPVVPAVTVLGMAGYLLLALVPALAVPVLWAAGLGSAWVGLVGSTLAGWPVATLPWPEGAGGAVLIAAAGAAVLFLLRAMAGRTTLMSGLSALLPGRLFGSLPGGWARFREIGRPGMRRRTGYGYAAGGCLAAGLLAGVPAALWLGPPGPGQLWSGPLWPGPPGGPAAWLVAACDVGQGDGLVVRTGEASALVIDAGPEPELMDRCLDRLGITSVEVLFLTHLHADHVGGVAGAVLDRPPARVIYSTSENRHELRRLSGLLPGGTPMRQGRAGEEGRQGPVQWQIIAAGPDPASAAGSPENDASLVLLLRITAADRELTALFTGDLEEEAMVRLLAANSALPRVDLLKVSHHGARNGGTEVIAALRPRAAVISVGRGNSYGHPAAQTLGALSSVGSAVWRTDEMGTILLGAADGKLQAYGLK